LQSNETKRGIEGDLSASLGASCSLSDSDSDLARSISPDKRHLKNIHWHCSTVRSHRFAGESMPRLVRLLRASMRTVRKAIFGKNVHIEFEDVLADLVAGSVGNYADSLPDDAADIRI